MSETQEIPSNSGLETHIYGNPEATIVEATKKAILATLEIMGYQGKPPVLKITSDWINDKYAGKVAGVYDWEDRSVCIGVAGLQSLLKPGSKASNEALSALVIAEETAHFVQDMEGRLPHELYLNTNQDHYTHPTEKEAGEISLQVANLMFPEAKFDR